MTPPKRPWHLEPYVWLIILFPATAVVAGLTTLYIAITSHDSLVVDDYYKQGLEINRTLERDQAATRHGLQAVLQLDQERHRIDLYLTTTSSDYQRPPQVTLSFRHHTRAGFDSTTMLERIGDDLYHGSLPELILGKWDLELAAQDWRLMTLMKVPSEVKELKFPRN
jgi:hypothetical protein